MDSSAENPHSPKPSTVDRDILLAILQDMQQLESLHALMAADGCTSFLNMSAPQQADVIAIASGLSLDLRCRLSDLLS